MNRCYNAQITRLHLLQNAEKGKNWLILRWLEGVNVQRAGFFIIYVFRVLKFFFFNAIYYYWKS